MFRNGFVFYYFKLILIRFIMFGFGLAVVISNCRPLVINPIALEGATSKETYKKVQGKWYNGSWPGDHGVEYDIQEDSIIYTYKGGSGVAPREKYTMKKISFDEASNKFIGEVIGESGDNRYVIIFIRDVVEGGKISLIKYGARPHPLSFLGRFLTLAEVEAKKPPPLESGEWRQYAAGSH